MVSSPGADLENSGYDPNAFAIGASFLFALACVALATLSASGCAGCVKNFARSPCIIEALADRNWEFAGGRAARPQPVRIAGPT